MLIKRPSGIKSSEITDRGLYLRRRDFLRTAIGTVALAGAAMDAAKAASNEVPGGRGRRLEGVTKGPFRTDEDLTPYTAITTYNNFFEFGTDKDQPSRNAARFKTSPWTIAVEGEAGRKGAYQLEDFIKPFALEERVYRTKSIVKIRFVKTQPFTTWQRQDPSRYGFYSNVNPDPVDSRWDQATERRIGEFFKRKTLLFNGYAEQVASLYAGLDLKKNF